MGICPGLSYAKSKNADLHLQGGEIRLSVSRNLDAVLRDWDQVTSEAPFFLQSPFLQSLETAPPEGVEFAYLIFHRNLQPVGIAYCQTFEFDAYKSLEASLESGDRRWYDPLRKFLARRINFRTLVCGNLLFSGPYAYFFTDTELDAPKLVSEALIKVSSVLDKDRGGIQGLFIKDFPPEHGADLDAFRKSGYRDFKFLPCMHMSMPGDWGSFEDYLEALSSKYRVRARRAFKKLGDVEKRYLNAREIKAWESELYELYREVADSADFNLATVPADYFYQLKNALPGDFNVLAYFDKGEPIAFISYFTGDFGLEAHFIGFDSAIQRKRQLYLNILYDLIREGIEMEAPRIHFARTASEIKSSVGAIACDQQCIIRHRTPWINRLVGPIVGTLQGPTEEWQPRHPFK
ncbi:MAG: GNAT family N-acetyltransferase [Bacteroidetes bacterium]|nr:GNAT family N-acetyltransferase [Bacteroidota bacterium]